MTGRRQCSAMKRTVAQWDGSSYGSPAGTASANANPQTSVATSSSANDLLAPPVTMIPPRGPVAGTSWADKEDYRSECAAKAALRRLDSGWKNRFRRRERRDT